MFGNIPSLSSLGNLGSMFKKMQEFNVKMQELNDRAKATRLSSVAGGGLVKVEVNALSEILACSIDPSLFTQGDCELLEDMILAATNGALGLAREKHGEIMRSLATNLEMSDLDGLKDLLFKNEDSTDKA
ncbi:MAG: YbaB/EbfC family nucleoid-associated protein [Thermoguttaceae bacterium]